ncbi:MAG TPA: hypothetical protein VJ848_08255 [Candidatus Angelobacter sp.]|nr:hypothetical protein [Candidatus Angelobacter sp.]
MTYLRGTTFSEQAAAAELTLGGVRPWAAPAEEDKGHLSGFVRSAKAVLAPAAVRDFFIRLYATDRLLHNFGWVLLLSVPVFAFLSYVDPGTAQFANPWFKPIKFAISFATFVWTVSLFMTRLRVSSRLLGWTRRTMTASIVVEMLCLAIQASRTANLTASPGLADWFIQQMTTAMVSINTAILVGLLALFCGKRDWIRIADGAMVLAIRLSIVIFLAGNAVGGYMLARGSHTVGAADGGPGLPFLNWSTIAGDLRIAHFIAIHAIQIVPLFAYLLWQMTPQPALKYRRLGVYAVAAFTAFLVGGTFVQAMLAHPVIALAR